MEHSRFLDIKYHTTEENLKELAKLQREILSVVSVSIYIFLIAKNLHDSKIKRIFAAKDRNRRKDYGKQ